MEDLGDRLVVSFRPRRRWTAILFLLVWVSFWTFGGVFAFAALVRSEPGTAAFLMFWLCLWAVGETVAVGEIAWQLVGREVLTVTAEWVEMRKQIRSLVWRRRVDAAAIQSVSAHRVPSDEDDAPRTDFGIRIVYSGGSEHVGELLSEHEAEEIAAAVDARIHPRSWWDDQRPFRRSDPLVVRTPTTTLSAGGFVIVQPSPRRLRTVAAVVVAALVALAALLATLA